MSCTQRARLPNVPSLDVNARLLWISIQTLDLEFVRGSENQP